VEVQANESLHSTALHDDHHATRTTKDDDADTANTSRPTTTARDYSGSVDTDDSCVRAFVVNTQK